MVRTQERILRWALETFGPCALNRQERAACLIEEAIEVAQAAGLPWDMVGKIAGRVYTRPAGELAIELGQTMITLQAMAELAGLDLDTCADTEWNRCRLVPAEHFRAKHAASVAAGVANIAGTT